MRTSTCGIPQYVHKRDIFITAHPQRRARRERAPAALAAGWRSHAHATRALRTASRRPTAPKSRSNDSEGAKWSGGSISSQPKMSHELIARRPLQSRTDREYGVASSAPPQVGHGASRGHVAREAYIVAARSGRVRSAPESICGEPRAMGASVRHADHAAPSSCSDASF